MRLTCKPPQTCSTFPSSSATWSLRAGAAISRGSPSGITVTTEDELLYNQCTRKRNWTQAILQTPHYFINALSTQYATSGRCSQWPGWVANRKTAEDTINLRKNTKCLNKEINTLYGETPFPSLRPLS